MRYAPTKRIKPWFYSLAPTRLGLSPTSAAAAATVVTAVVVLWVTVRRSRRQISDSSSELHEIKPGKHFACFLRHYKREAGTEARLVKKYLTEILASRASTKELFLDSGESLFHPRLP